MVLDHELDRRELINLFQGLRVTESQSCVF